MVKVPIKPGARKVLPCFEGGNRDFPIFYSSFDLNNDRSLTVCHPKDFNCLRADVALSFASNIEMKNHS